MSGQIIRPTDMAIPMGVTLHGLRTGENGQGPIEVESRRERFVLAALHAILTRETSTLANARTIGHLAVNFADAALAAMAAPSPAPASPVPGPGPVSAG